jgi:SSS family solute:Na+ symporter
MLVPSATINDFGFLSMGLRGSVVFIPMSCALFLPGKIDRRFVLAATICGPVAVLVGNFIDLPFDSLFLGLAVVLVLTVLGAVFKKGNDQPKADAKAS